MKVKWEVVSNEFWQVELMVGMGPLLLGSDEATVRKALVDQGLDAEPKYLDNTGQITLPSIKTRLTFSNSHPRNLTHIEVDDERLRFATLGVIGNRAHGILGIFKVSRKDTLWTRGNAQIDEQAVPFRGNMSPELSRNLLANGTLWIKKYGLGLTLNDGLVATVHLCDPKDVPRDGVGQWTKEQQMLSEVSEVVVQAKEPLKQSIKPIGRALTLLALFFALGGLIWWAVSLQRKWDALADIPAVVVDLEPPPPHPLPNNITVDFMDSSGVKRRSTLKFNHFEMSPKIGDEVNVRFLPESPDLVLGPVAVGDVGFNAAFPYGIGILVAFTILFTLLGGTVRTRSGNPRIR